MKKRLKTIPLLAGIILAVSLPAGFAIAQVMNQPEGEEPPITHLDPDPSTDAIKIGDAFTKAMESGDQGAIDQAADAVREEWFSRLGPEEKVAAENSPPEPKVPAGTYAYINDAITPAQVEACRDRLDDDHDDQLCELIVLYGEGKIEAGPYTLEEVQVILSTERKTR